MPNNCCCRIAVQIVQIYDGARLERHISRTLALSDFTPSAYAPPLTYIGASYSGTAAISSQAVTPAANGQSRVSLTYGFPVTVNYTDAGGNGGRATSYITDGADVLLRLPSSPYYFEVETEFLSRIGRISGSSSEIRGCLLAKIKVLTRRDAVINACKPNYPLASETQDAVCAALFGD